MDHPILEIHNLNKKFSGVPILKDVNVTLSQGKILGLVGENGAGKSTLMNILGGVHPKDSGAMKLWGQDYDPHNPSEATEAGIAFIHQELNLFTNLSIAENFFLSKFPKKRLAGLPLPWINKAEMVEQTQKALAQIELFHSPNTIVDYLSPAERQLVEIAKAVCSDAKIIIFDEPTTSLTEHEIEKLFGIIEQLKHQQISMIYISHNLDHVFRLADEIVVLRDGENVGHAPTHEFTPDQVISLMVGRSIDQFYPPRDTRPEDEIVLQVNKVSQMGVCKDISFSLHKKEVLGIFGLMGSGRTELARILYGLDPYETGEFFFEGKPLETLSPRIHISNQLAFLTEDRRNEGLLLDANVIDNIGLPSWKQYAQNPFRWIDKNNADETFHQSAIATNVRCASFETQPASTLSGGNQQKVVFAKWLTIDPKVMILDEPTRGIDVGAKVDIYSLINDRVSHGGSVLVISSEIEELLGICDRILVMNKGEIRAEFDKSQFHRETILEAALEEWLP